MKSRPCGWVFRLSRVSRAVRERRLPRLRGLAGPSSQWLTSPAEATEIGSFLNAAAGAAVFKALQVSGTSCSNYCPSQPLAHYCPKCGPVDDPLFIYRPD